MRESKWELKQLNIWKSKVRMLRDEQEALTDRRRSPALGDEMLGGEYRTEIQKMNDIVERRDEYQLAIDDLEFLIQRLEKAIAELLTKEQREVCLIYAQHPNNSRAREYEALVHGYSRTTYYRLLDESMTILDGYLEL